MEREREYRGKGRQRESESDLVNVLNTVSKIFNYQTRITRVLVRKIMFTPV